MLPPPRTPSEWRCSDSSAHAVRHRLWDTERWATPLGLGRAQESAFLTGPPGAAASVAHTAALTPLAPPVPPGSLPELHVRAWGLM